MKIRIFDESGGRELAIRFWNTAPRTGEFIELYGDEPICGFFEVVSCLWIGDGEQELQIIARKAKS